MLFSKFFRKHYFGVDISSDSIKLVELTSSKQGPKLLRFKEIKLPANVLGLGKVQDSKSLERILFPLKKDFNLKMVNIVLPAGALSEVESYRVAFLNSGISIKSFEPEAQAIFRLVAGKQIEETFMIINLNSKESDIAIISNGVIKFNSTLEFGGEKITSALAEMLQVNELEAEKIKREYGFRHNMEHADIFKIISTAVTVLRDDLAKFFINWHTRKGEMEHRPAITKIILCGSEAGLVGLPEYLSVSLRNKVELADVWLNLATDKKNIPEMSLEKSFTFSAALGAGLKQFIDP